MYRGIICESVNTRNIEECSGFEGNRTRRDLTVSEYVPSSLILKPIERANVKCSEGE